MKRTAPALLATTFNAFCELHRPIYLAHAHARLPREEARIVIALLFELVADNWITVVADPRPAARVWDMHTQVLANRSLPTTPAEDVLLLHDTLHLSIDRIATVTGRDAATIATLLAAARRARSSPARSGQTRTTVMP
ncbi:hypothetical protein [Streptomyces sp. bgisy126]|uniref:hypothetical protein n=1 Tax=unclassified Streptomyces TaxID=2593676 RepID=UPI003EBDEF9C